MMKHMKKAVSFFMAVCLLAGNSYVNTEATTSVTMTEWTETAKTEKPKEPLFPVGMSSYLKNRRTSVAEAAEVIDTSGGYVFYNPAVGEGSGAVVEHRDVVPISGSTKFLLTKVDEDDNPIGYDAGVIIESIEPADSAIARIERDGSGDLGCNVTIVAVAPGETAINVSILEPVYDENGIAIKDDAGNPKKTRYTFTCTVQVKLEIDKSETNYWKKVSGKDVLVLKQSDGAYQIKLKGVEDSRVNPELITWMTPADDGIIEIDEATGTLKPVGAGLAEIALQPKKSSQKAEEITVIVQPLGTIDDPDGTLSDKPTQQPYHTSSPTFTLYTNGNPASNMKWEIYSCTWNGSKETRKPITEKDTSLLTYIIGSNDGNVYFSDVKAGTYKIIGYASDEKDYESQSWNKLEYDVIVDMTLQSKSLYMNIGDTYSILNNSNVPENRFSELLSVDYFDSVDGPFVAELDSKTGLVTARNEGKVDIVVKYRTSPMDSIYKTGDVNRNLDITYSFHIIDEISLNTTSLNMYTGTTYQLIANTTDRTAPVTWESSDEKLATVDENGLVTAKKATGTKPVQITASQVIDGVKKSVVCNIYIQAAVTSVKITPDNVVMNIGEYETLRATVSPSGLVGTYLHWLSSDTSIFTITDSTDLTVTIQGKSGGTAVLTALNAENIVVGYCKVTVNQEAQGIKLSQTAVTIPLSHKTYQLYATLSPDNTTNTKVIWDSQNKGVVTVDQNGLVTLKKAGTATISVQSQDNPLLIAYCTFTVQDVVSSLKLDYHDIEMYSGETRRLSYVMTPTLIDNPKVIWTSFDTSVATVDASGMVTAKGPGTTQIMIMSASNGSYYDICTVVVKQKATSVKMNYKEITMNRGDYFDMEVTIAPVNATEASLIWESLNPTVATVSSTGRITARAEGTAIIAVRTQSGVTSYCTVKVLEPVISLELDPTDIIIDVGEIFQIDPIFKPVAPTIQDVKWVSYNEDIATVNALGEVEGVSRGSTIVTCETVDGGYRAFCLIQVVDPAMIVTVTPDNYRLGYGKTVQLEATVTNHGKPVENVPIIWESSNEDICTVDEYGKVTGIDYGYATIRAEVDDDYGAYATCEIRVVREVTSIKLNHNVLTIIQGHTASLKADIQPSNATYTSATFTSDDEKIAVVDEDGVITAIKPGTTWIWAKAKDNSGKYARCYVTVIEPIPATGVTVSDKKVVLVAGETKKLLYTVKPTNTTDDITWSSGNEAIATVDSSGMVTAHRTGSTTVTIMTTSGKTAQVEVIVIGLSRTKLELPVYTKYSRLTVDGAEGTIRWDVEDQTICEVNNGVVTARKVGTTYVSATVNGRTLRCKVTVTANNKKK